jgi:hypothetical protein
MKKEEGEDEEWGWKGGSGGRVLEGVELVNHVEGEGSR